uniref:Uncharacterized protein n=1 Tax=Anguilla anguilla TaxID=7936 RepID=A0A0E9Q271_ANGAN
MNGIIFFFWKRTEVLLSCPETKEILCRPVADPTVTLAGVSMGPNSLCTKKPL